MQPTVPEKFVVRNPAIRQSRLYPKQCAHATGIVLAGGMPGTARGPLSSIADAVAQATQSQQDALNPQMSKREYMRPRECFLSTPFENSPSEPTEYPIPLQAVFGKTLEEVMAGRLPLGRIIEWTSPVTGNTMKLTRFSAQGVSRGRLEGFIGHPPRNADDPAHVANNHEIELALEHEYANAMNASLPADMRQDAALRCYSLISHDCPVERGSATLSRIALECMASAIGFEVPYTRPGINLNIEAQARTPDEFVAEWKRGVFTDAAITRDEIQAWQHQHTPRQAPSR